MKKYLENQLPNDYNARKDDYIGMWLINALVKKTSSAKTFTNCATDLKYLQSRQFTEKWHFLVPVRYQDSVVLPRRRVLEFHNMVMAQMYAEIIMEFEHRKAAGEIDFIQNTIDNFRDRYKIWDRDLEDDRIRKMYLRHRERNRAPGNSQFLSLGMFFAKI
ncbi:hypothetical protein [Dyadobacter soli]|uniref:hypothetical protein n=1 Tax=Dyadobacter soli TaxID=659014 RepID=UPI0015A43AFC|nr:hypothetical protein [Dyadobacter soli]